MFKNLHELITRMPDETTCRNYYEEQRWNGKPVCPYCGFERYKLKSGKHYKCASKTCYRVYRVTVGTIFEDNNIPLNKWFMAMYLCSAHKKGISSVQLAKDIGDESALYNALGFEMRRESVKHSAKESVKTDYYGTKIHTNTEYTIKYY
jgi:transposase-like protein